MTDIFVESEFAPLRTVVLAQSELALPDDIPDSDLDFLSSGSAETVVAGEDFGIACPQRAHLWLRALRVSAICSRSMMPACAPCWWTG